MIDASLQAWVALSSYPITIIKEVEMRTFDFGVYYKGQLVFSIGRTKCTISQAAVIVGILDLAKDSLRPGHYFACDYV